MFQYHVSCLGLISVLQSADYNTNRKPGAGSTSSRCVPYTVVRMQRRSKVSHVLLILGFSNFDGDLLPVAVIRYTLQGAGCSTARQHPPVTYQEDPYMCVSHPGFITHTLATISFPFSIFIVNDTCFQWYESRKCWQTSVTCGLCVDFLNWVGPHYTDIDIKNKQHQLAVCRN